MVATAKERLLVRTAECGEVPFQLVVSIVMPCLNEAETLEFCIVEAQGLCLKRGSTVKW